MIDSLNWSRFAWAYFHLASTGYPVVPTKTDAFNYHEFYRFFGLTLPCSTCSKHYSRLFREIPIEAGLVSRDMLFKWTVDVHNAVNVSIGKTQMDLEKAIDRYNNTVFVDPPNFGLVLTVFFMSAMIACLLFKNLFYNLNIRRG